MALTQVIGRGLGTQTTLAGSNTLVLDTDGNITKPLQPAFRVHKNGTKQTNIALNSHVDITFSTEVFDVGSNFASNTFTAPVTGRYIFILKLRLDAVDSAANFYIPRITTSNASHLDIFNPDVGQDNDYWGITHIVLADMDANDTASATLYQGGGTSQTDIEGDSTYTYFSGHLVC